MATRRHLLLPVSVVDLMLTAAVFGLVDQSNNPRIIEHPEDQYVARNEPATLNCKAEGEPPPVITWYRNGLPVVTANENPSSHRMLLPSGQLFFLRIIHNKNSRPDVGVYYCNATNPETKVSVISKNATLEIASLGGEFREQPRSLELPVGSDAVLDCKPPKGEPEPRVRWRKDNDPVRTGDRWTISDSGSLRIRDVRKEDSGLYVCIAYNIGGEKDSNPARLLVRERPKISEGPKDLTVQENLDALFNCWASGDPEPTIIWKKVEGQMPQGRAHILEDRSLKIERVRQSDDGVYVCHAENSIGFIEAEAKLTVHSQPTFVVTPRDKTVGSGRRVVMRCQVTGNPPPAVFWNREFSQTLMFPNQDYDRMSVSEDGSLIIDPVRKEDSGEYVCKALSLAGSAYAKAKLEVRDVDSRPPPIIYHGPQNQTLPINSVATMPCSASGDPAPLISWYRNGRPVAVRDPRFVLLDSGTLQITDLRKSDSGVFTCKAISETGESEWNAHLVVDTPSNTSIIFHRTPEPSAFPGSPSKPSASDVSDTSVRLTWKANANHGASAVQTYTVEYFSHETGEGWIIASDAVLEETYTVQGLRPNTSYMFLIRARNAHGLSLPSHISATIKTKAATGESSGRHQLQTYDLTLVADKLTSTPPIIAILTSSSKALSSTSIRLVWEVRRNLRYIEGYIIKYRPAVGDSGGTSGSGAAAAPATVAEKWAEDRLPDPSTSSHTIQNLAKYTNYEIAVVPYYKSVVGLESALARIRTLEDVPSAPPQNIRAKMIDNTTMYLSWEPPPRHYINGVLVGYKIHIIGSDSRFNRQIPLNSSLEAIYIHHMSPDMTYQIQMSAVSRKGAGLLSDFIVIGSQLDGERQPFVREPWFVATLIGALGSLVWLVLCIISILLYRRCRAWRLAMKTGATMNRNSFFTPDNPTRSTNAQSYLDAETYMQKDNNLYYGGDCNGYRAGSTLGRRSDLSDHMTSAPTSSSSCQPASSASQRQQSAAAYADFRSLAAAANSGTASASPALPAAAAAAMIAVSYPPGGSVFRPIKPRSTGPCSSSQDESWSRFGDDTLSYNDDDDDIDNFNVRGNIGNYGQLHKQPVLYLPPPPADPPPNADKIDRRRNNSPPEDVADRPGRSVDSGRRSSSRDVPTPQRTRHGRHSQQRNLPNDRGGSQSRSVAANETPTRNRSRREYAGNSRSGAGKRSSPDKFDPLDFDSDENRPVPSLCPPAAAANWSKKVPRYSDDDDDDESDAATGRGMYSPHALSEPAEAPSSRADICSRNAVDGIIGGPGGGGSLERHRGPLMAHHRFGVGAGIDEADADPMTRHSLNVHQGPSSAAAALMHELSPPSPAPMDPDCCSDVDHRTNDTMRSVPYIDDDDDFAPDPDASSREFGRRYGRAGNENGVEGGAKMQKGCEINDSDNCSSVMSSSAFSSDGLSCYTDADLHAATTAPANVTVATTHSTTSQPSSTPRDPKDGQKRNKQFLISR